MTTQSKWQSLPEETFPSPMLEVICGSTLHGTAVDDGLEDLDLMAIVIETSQQTLGMNIPGFESVDTWVLRTKPEGVRSEAGDIDLTAYGLRKYLTLALRGNPTILLALFAPPAFVRRYTLLGQQLQTLSPKIISRNVFEPYLHYMREQHERLLGKRGQMKITRPELIAAYGYDTKYAAHIVRLGIQGAELLNTGRLTLPMPDGDRELVRRVRLGTYTLIEVSEMIVEAERALRTAFANTSLRERPDMTFVRDWMVNAYEREWASRRDFNLRHA